MEEQDYVCPGRGATRLLQGADLPRPSMRTAGPRAYAGSSSVIIRTLRMYPDLFPMLANPVIAATGWSTTPCSPEVDEMGDNC